MTPNPASWIIRNKRTGEVICETFNRASLAHLNIEKYEAVPIMEHLQNLNNPATRYRNAFTGEVVTLKNDAAIVRFFDNRNPADWELIG